MFIAVFMTIINNGVYAEVPGYSGIRFVPYYMDITNFMQGFGIGTKQIKPVPYGVQFSGITNINGYHFLSHRSSGWDEFQLTRSFFAGIGIGVSAYNDGYLFPVFLDIRYWFNVNGITPYIYGDVGLLMSFKDFDMGTRMFINGGFGASKCIFSNFLLEAGTGLYTQMGNSKPRASFIKLEIGFAFRY